MKPKVIYALVLVMGAWHAAGALVCAGAPKPTGTMQFPVAGHVHALTIFARFQGEGGEVEVPDFAREIFDGQRPGSLTHYYREMSRGQFRLTGECLPEWYVSKRMVEEYLPPNGSFGAFSSEILAEVDARIDLSLYDNDGPDGEPNSGDDDGYVDFIFLVTRSAPRDFIVDAATGIAALGLGNDFITNDAGRRGGFIRVRADGHRDGVGGVLQQGGSFETAVGSMAHEFGHFLGLVDLYDLSYDIEGEEDLEKDSGGIGYWGLMGHGSRGWNDRGGPNPLSAWSLKRLGWLGVANRQLVVLDEDREGAEFSDVNAGGPVYQLPIRGELEYFLVEHRRRGSSYYERNLPAEGLLLWHVDEQRMTNNDEKRKKVDLVCADGLYRDAGYPLGGQPAAEDGGDNLDFWAHDERYRTTHGGNLGDATDPFDGVRFREFWAISNPMAPAGISLTDIRAQGEGMVADLRLHDRRRAGFIAGVENWADTIDVVGDIDVIGGGRLNIAAGTLVRFAADGLRRGRDPERSELVINGILSIHSAGRKPVLFTSMAEEPRPGDWGGIRMGRLGQVIMRQAAVEYAVNGIASDGLDAQIRDFRALDLEEVVIRHTLGDGIHLEGNQEPVSLNGLQVHGAGGVGVYIEGEGLVRIGLAHLSENQGEGLVRRGGFLECLESRFVDNGAAADTAANLLLGRDVFGEVRDNTFSGGLGVRCVGTREVVIADNLFDRQRIGLIAESARPRISGNLFRDSQLVLQILGAAVPSRLDLNVVQEAEQLVENRTERPLMAANNWWGRTDEEWIGARMSGQIVWRPFLNFDPRQPVGFSLEQNFPNPFNEKTVIGYTVGIDEPIVTGLARTTLEVRSITGGLVRRLVDEPAAPGIFEVVWDGRDEQGGTVASGVYYYQLQVGPIFVLKRLLLLK